MCLFLASCGTTTRVEKIGARAYPAKPAGCDIAIYKDEKLIKPFSVIGQIDAHIKKNIFWGGVVQLEDEGYKELKKKACQLGGDAVVIDDYMESSAAELTHVHIWATVIKFQ